MISLRPLSVRRRRAVPLLAGAATLALVSLLLAAGLAGRDSSAAQRAPVTYAIGWNTGDPDPIDYDYEGGGDSYLDDVGTGTVLAAADPSLTFRAFGLLVANDEQHGGGVILPAGLFKKPFAGEYRATNFVDHDIPKEFVDTNGRFITYWAENMRVNIDGHSGYDWILPEGTPLFAAGSGRVYFAGDDVSAACPILNNRVVASKSIGIEHEVMIAGVPTKVRSIYFHTSRVDVKVGDIVERGAPIGLSGNTGCSTSPHLHFEVRRLVPSTGRYVTIDPYGWDGTTPDPWSLLPEGAESAYLWEEAPLVYNELRTTTPPAGNSPIDIVAVRWIGHRDDLNPNNEFVELALDPRFATGPTTLTGFTLRNNNEDTFNFPSGFAVRPNEPFRIYSGAGTNTPNTIYMGRTSGFWDNRNPECARLTNANGGVFRFQILTSCK